MNPETKALTMWLKTLIEMKNKMKISKYTPFGEEWKKELSKLSKKDIIEIAQRIGNESERLKELLRENHLPVFAYLQTNETDRTVDSAWYNYEAAKRRCKEQKEFMPKKEFMVVKLPIN